MKLINLLTTIAVLVAVVWHDAPPTVWSKRVDKLTQMKKQKENKNVHVYNTIYSPHPSEEGY